MISLQLLSERPGIFPENQRNLTAPEALETLKNPEHIHVKKGEGAEIL